MFSDTVRVGLCRYFCIQGVYALNTSTDQLTVNMVLTARKVASLLASVAFFGNAFSVYHVAGSVLVFGGVVAFSFVNQSTQLPLSPKCAATSKEASKEKLQ